MSTDTISMGSYRLEPLNATNWMPWKRRMLAILREQGLEEYIINPAKKEPPELTTSPDNSADIAKWKRDEQKARTRLELAIGDSEMGHIIGAETAYDIWQRLCQVKEAKGLIGVLSVRRSLYRAQASEGDDLVEHINQLRALQAELAQMNSTVNDDDFVMIIITSLPESWDSFTTSYLGARGTTTDRLSSANFIPLLLEEDRRRRGRNGGVENSLQARNKPMTSKSGKPDAKECFNCGRKGHIKKDCWAKGGGQEGKGPRGRKGKERANQAAGGSSTDLNAAIAVSYMARFNGNEMSKLVWNLDSGTTSSICTTREAFIDYRPLKDMTIQGIGPEAAVAEGIGSIDLNFKVGNDIITHRIKDVLHVPKAPNCLLSLSRFDEGGGEVEFGKGKCVLKGKDGKVVGIGRKINRLYELDARAVIKPERANIAVPSAKSWDKWHAVFGHIGMSTLEKMHNQNVVAGFEVDKSSIPSRTCTSCLEAKLTHQPFPQQAENRCRKPGEGYHSDVWGPIKTTSIGKFKYYLSFTDDATRYVHVYFLRDKAEAAEKIREHVLASERRFGYAPAWIRFDNGKELVNAKTKALAVEKGMEIHTTAPHSPSQNGVAERLNRTLLDLVRAMMIAKNTPAYLWDEALHHAVYLRNRVLVRALPGKTPYEAYMGTKPRVDHLHEFGCDVWVLDESPGRSKLAPKANKMTFVGIMEGSKAIRYYDKAKRTVKVSRNIGWHEGGEIGEVIVPGLGLEEGLSVETKVEEVPIPVTSESDNEIEDVKRSLVDSQTSSPLLSPTKPPTRETSPEFHLDDLFDGEFGRTMRERPKINYKVNTGHKPFNSEPSTSKNEKTGRKRVKNRRSDRDAKAKATEPNEASFYSKKKPEDVDYIPRTIQEAFAGSNGEEWRKAVAEELGMIEKMGTYEMVELPEGRDTIGCRWVFTKKRDENGQVTRFKARLVAQGYSQQPGMDYDLNGTFAPVMRFETLRACLALSAIHKFRTFQLDVKGAYLNGRVDEEIYMKQPPGFDDGSGRVCKLKRSLYGLKQAGNVWNREFNAAMKDFKFTQLKSDYCAYIRRKDDVVTILLLWVDDIIGFTNSEAEERLVAKQLGGRFEIKELGRPGMLLGIKIDTSDDGSIITLSQTHYIDSILKRFGLEDANSVATPLDPNVNLDYDDPHSSQSENPGLGSTLFATAIGSLSYAALATRFDIAFAVFRLAQFTKNPQPKHWTAVKRIFRYLKGTKDFKLTYGGPDQDWTTELSIYCDADWASSADRKSVSGYVFTLAGGAIAWSSKKQTSVALSTAEAEYVAATHVAKQVLWYRALFQELGFSQPQTSIIFTDNQAAVAIAHHPEFHSRTKHIDIALHFLRDLVKSGTLETVYINTKDNLADIFTKGLSRPTHQDLVQRIGLLETGCDTKEGC